MKYADCMAFPVSQGELLNPNKDERDSSIDLNIKLDVAHITVAPPVAKALSKKGTDFTTNLLMSEIDWFNKSILVQAEEMGIRVVRGLQRAPDDCLDKDNLDRLYDAGVRIITPAYDDITPFGSGFCDQKAPLTNMGVSLIKRMASMGMTVDISHLGHQCARDAIETAVEYDCSIMASHSGCYAVYADDRNIPDDIIKSLVKAGGIFGLLTMTWLLDEESKEFSAFKKHLDHLVDLVGISNICVGSDARFITETKEEQKVLFSKMKPILDPNDTKFNVSLPEQPVPLNTPRRMDVMKDLLNDHLAEYEIENILGGNLIKWFENRNYI